MLQPQTICKFKPKHGLSQEMTLGAKRYQYKWINEIFSKKIGTWRKVNVLDGRAFLENRWREDIWPEKAIMNLNFTIRTIVVIWGKGKRSCHVKAKSKWIRLSARFINNSWIPSLLQLWWKASTSCLARKWGHFSPNCMSWLP